MNPKVLIVVGVVLVLLLVAGLTVGAASDPQRGVIGGDWVQGLGRLLVINRPLNVDDIVGADPLRCRQDLRNGVMRLAPGQACLLEIGESSVPRRELQVTLAAGAQAVVVMDHTAAGLLTARNTFTPGKKGRATVYAFKEGGRLSLACVGIGQPCELRFG